ncbi:thiaminase II [Halobacillus salinus]|uniref:Aminopyrimidine aminohydrolase n=1 Tax=Halobacillus salinus TaxID=192814 RepID=A0A4Z0H5Q6_9BACI|nr:thiaminase II [Halobacillus salinus]TGB05069.1 thiaminase II [Halobacillus salinus]
MSFTNQLREENEHLFREIYRHPFVQGIGKGELNPEAVAHYVKADYEYLNKFMQVYGLAISKSAEREEIEFFNEQVQFILHSEVHPHKNLCEYIGIPYEDLQGYDLPPTADHYIKHMLYHALQGGMGETLAALLPCPWTYLEIGKKLEIEFLNESQDHPFQPWITFYTEDAMMDVTNFMRSRLDQLAEKASDSEKQKMREAFHKSCQLEWSFWEMAITCEGWLTEEEVSTR